MIVNLRSDTFSKPCLEMRQAMFDAEVGDDVYQEDPTVISKEVHTVFTIFHVSVVILTNNLFRIRTICC